MAITTHDGINANFSRLLKNTKSAQKLASGLISATMK